MAERAGREPGLMRTGVGTRFGYWLAGAVLLVNLPYLSEAFMAADGYELSGAWQVLLILVRSNATGLVLVVGGMFILHEVIHPGRQRGWLAAAVGFFFLASCVLITPLVASKLWGVEMPEAIRRIGEMVGIGGPEVWWSLANVLGIDLVAGGVVVAQARKDRRVAAEVDEAEELERAVVRGFELERRVEELESELAAAEGQEKDLRRLERGEIDGLVAEGLERMPRAFTVAQATRVLAEESPDVAITESAVRGAILRMEEGGGLTRIEGRPARWTERDEQAVVVASDEALIRALG